MRWVVVWICACAADNDVLVVHVANTRDSCHATAQALTDRIGGAYICARYHEHATTDKVEIWPTD